MFDRRVDEFLYIGKGHNLIEFALDLASPHPEDRGVQIDVLAPGQLRVKPGAYFEQAAHSAVQIDAAGGRLSDSGKNLEQSGLASSVASDYSEHLARHHVQIHVDR